MRKGIILSALMIPLFLLSGCLGVGEGQKLLDQALTIRGEYLAMEGFSAQAELTADYGQRVCSYTLEVDASSNEITLTITQPDVLSGITARCRNGDGFLEYDGLVIETGALNKQGLSPMSAIPEMLEQLKSGYLMAWSSEADGSLRITCGQPDSTPDQGTVFDFWLDGNSHALLRGEVSVDGRRCIQCTFSSFTKE